MKLLLDEMHAPAVAALLRNRGHDVDAVKERADLVGLADADLLAVAAAEGRALVTENVKDFAALDRLWTSTGRRHAGIVFTHARRFPRAAGNYRHKLADALALLFPEAGSGFSSSEPFVWWLAADH